MILTKISSQQNSDIGAPQHRALRMPTYVSILLRVTSRGKGLPLEEIRMVQVQLVATTQK